MKRSRRNRLAALLGLGAIAAGAAGMGATYAAFSEQTGTASNVVTAAPDFRGPTIAPFGIGKTSGTTLGSIRAGNSYRVYANVSDVGSPASGIQVVTANVSNITTGQVAVPLSAGSYSAGGQSFNYRSNTLTANVGLPNGSYAFTVRAMDIALNSTTVSGSVSVDNSGATATNIQTTNGSIAGRPQVGDTITFTFSEPMDPDSLLPGWNGSTTNVLSGFQDASGGDQFQVWNTDFDTQVRLGTVSMGRTDFTTSQLGFLTSTMTLSGNVLTVTLGGTVYGTVTTVGGTGTMRWTPSASAQDVAGNAMSTTALNEPGTADRDF